MQGPVCTDDASYRWEGLNRKQDQVNWKFEALNVIQQNMIGILVSFCILMVLSWLLNYKKRLDYVKRFESINR